MRSHIFRGAVPALLACLVAGTALAAPQRVTVLKNDRGMKLQVDGEELMVLGMNWGYVPIGENYAYSLWNQPDDVIEAALAREMPLLQNMGVNTIRQYVGIPPRWLRYIYETYGIYTILNHPMARYGFTMNGVWIPNVDYADPRLREAVKTEILETVREFEDTPGLLMWLLGNENNYGLTWTGAETEALPEGEREAARARYLYSLFDEVAAAIQTEDPDHPVAICNGDVQYLDIIAEECTHFDVFGTNVYRGISARDLFQVVKDRMNLPVLFTEFGADAWNARLMREDQRAQAKYLIGQWKEIYEKSYGKGQEGNAIGGLTFQWADGWWKFGQEDRLDIHDTNASWPNGGYVEDYVEGENNMNEEWWGIMAKGPPDHRGLFELYPRAAYYALKEAYTLDPYGPDTDLETIEAHFSTITPVSTELRAQGDRAALTGDLTSKVRVSGLRAELETYSTGGQRISTPKDDNPQDALPAYLGFDHMQSFYTEFEAKPTENLMARLSLNILGNVPVNPIDEIYYENRGRQRTITIDQNGQEELLDLEGIERVKVYQGSVSWDDRWFTLDGFYRTGHYHWGSEGDFFGLYLEAYYGDAIDIYNSDAPVGVEIDGKRGLEGLTFAIGPQLWWGANPAFMVKYSRNLLGIEATAVFQEDVAEQSEVSSSVAVPLPQNRKLSLQGKTGLGPFELEAGVLWSGEPRVGESFELTERDENDNVVIYEDTVRDTDAFGTKGKLTFQSGRWNWYGQAAYMGAVAMAGPTATTTFTGWQLKDSGWGNQANILTGLAVNVGDYQVSPNFLWQKPLIGPIDPDAATVLRNIQDDPFAVRYNREMTAVEVLLTYDPTPATWMWAWDNIVREDAKLAYSLGFTFRHMPTTMDAAIGILEDGRTTFAFPASTPARDLWEVRGRVVSRLSPSARLVANAFAGTGEPNGDDPRLIHRYGLDARLAVDRVTLETAVKVNDWGPYDYHRDFNNTFPLQIMGDIAYTLGSPKWFGLPETRIGTRTTWRSLDQHSNRYCPERDGNGDCVADPDGELGYEWEIRTYLHFAL